jgi:hypothetical protein
VTEAVEPSELRVGDKREEAGRLHADQGVGGSLHDQHGTGDPVEAGRDVERAGQDGLLVGRGVGEVQQQLAGVPLREQIGTLAGGLQHGSRLC